MIDGVLARLRFNVRLVMQVRACSDAEIIRLTNMDVRLSVKDRRTALIRAFRLQSVEDAIALEQRVAQREARV